MTNRSLRILSFILTTIVTIISVVMVIDYFLAVKEYRIYLGFLPVLATLAFPIMGGGIIILIWTKKASAKLLGGILVASNPLILSVAYSFGKIAVLEQRSFWLGLVVSVAVLYLFFHNKLRNRN